jgi:hypothetical protein
MRTKKAPSKRIFDTTHGAFNRPIGLPSEVYGVFIEVAIIQTPYTLDGYKLSKVGTLQSGPIQEPTYVGVEGGGEGFKIACHELQSPKIAHSIWISRHHPWPQLKSCPEQRA